MTAPDSSTLFHTKLSQFNLTIHSTFIRNVLSACLTLSLCISSTSSFSSNGNYKSVVVVGHLYPLYEIYSRDKTRLDNRNINELVHSISQIQNVEKLILLGDTYVDDRKEVYHLVNKDLILPLGLPTISLPGNHETLHLDSFIESGGVKSSVLDIYQFRIIMFSPWSLINGSLTMSIDNEAMRFFESSISETKENIILVTDMVHHKNSDVEGWDSHIVPLLNRHKTRYVVVGDNDRVNHRYSWVKRGGLTYIHQGIAHNYYVPNINTFLEIRLYELGEIKFIPHTIPFDGLSEVYESSLADFDQDKQSIYSKFSSGKIKKAIKKALHNICHNVSLCSYLSLS